MSRGSALDGLPKQFVASMRVLFDIMDEAKTGKIRLSDIEARWPREEEEEQEEAGPGGGGDARKRRGKRLPRGVVECLRKVTPTDGTLTFDRFCAGLKICLLRNKVNAGSEVKVVVGLKQASNANGNVQVIGHNNNNNNCNLPKAVPSQSVQPTMTARILPPNHNRAAVHESQPQPRSGATEFHHPSRTSNVIPMTATVRPSMTFQQRTLSMPLLEHIPDGGGGGGSGGATVNVADHAHQAPPGGEKVRSRIRTELRGYKSESKIAALVTDNKAGGNGQSNLNLIGQSSLSGQSNLNLVGQSSLSGQSNLNLNGPPRSRHVIMTVLHNWHMGMLNDADKNRAPNNKGPKSNLTSEPEGGNIPAVPGGEVRNIKFGDDFPSSGVTSDGDINSARSKESSHYARKSNLRRREPRRHTLASGIDYNMLKRMKQLEQEKDILLQGLEAIDKARSWYLKQIIGVQDKMKYIGQNNGHLEYSTEAHQERLNFQMAQISEVNQHLGALVESSERGFPLHHMNLAIRHHHQHHHKAAPPPMHKTNHQGEAAAAALGHLKEMNQLLSEEVSEKSERITQLEREKAALVRELFQARSSSSSSTSALARRGDAANATNAADDTTLM